MADEEATIEASETQESVPPEAVTEPASEPTPEVEAKPSILDKILGHNESPATTGPVDSDSCYNCHIHGTASKLGEDGVCPTCGFVKPRNA